MSAVVECLPARKPHCASRHGTSGFELVRRGRRAREPCEIAVGLMQPLRRRARCCTPGAHRLWLGQLGRDRAKQHGHGGLDLLPFPLVIPHHQRKSLCKRCCHRGVVHHTNTCDWPAVRLADGPLVLRTAESPRRGHCLSCCTRRPLPLGSVSAPSRWCSSGPWLAGCASYRGQPLRQRSLRTSAW